MSSKKKKNFVWRLCPICNVWLCGTDFDNHRNKENDDCCWGIHDFKFDDDTNQTKQSFNCKIKLIALKLLKKNSPRNTPFAERYKTYINPMTMQEFQLNMDEPVSINNSLISYVWPDAHISTNSILIDDSLFNDSLVPLQSMLDLLSPLKPSPPSSASSKFDDMCVVQKLSGDGGGVTDLSRVKFILLCENKMNIDRVKLKTLLQFELINLYVKLGTKLKYSFFMDDVVLQVIHVIPAVSHNNETNAMTNTSIADDGDGVNEFNIFGGFHERSVVRDCEGGDLSRVENKNPDIKNRWLRITENTKILLTCNDENKNNDGGDDDDDDHITIDQLVVKNYEGVSWDNLGGYDDQKHYLKTLLDQSLMSQNAVGCLICGPIGSGRSSLGCMLSSIYQHLSFTCICPFQLMSLYESGGRSGILTYIQRIIDEDKVNILFIDDLDYLCHDPYNSDDIVEDGRTVDGSRYIGDDIMGVMMEAVDLLFKSPNCKMLVASAERPDSLHSDWLTSTRFNYTVQLEPPTKSERLQILKICMNEMLSSSSSSSFTPVVHSLTDDELTSLCESCHAYLPQDMYLLCQHALISSQQRINKVPLSPTSDATPPSSSTATTTLATSMTTSMTSLATTITTSLTEQMQSLTISNLPPTTTATLLATTTSSPATTTSSATTTTTTTTTSTTTSSSTAATTTTSSVHSFPTRVTSTIIPTMITTAYTTSATTTSSNTQQTTATTTMLLFSSAPTTTTTTTSSAKAMPSSTTAKSSSVSSSSTTTQSTTTSTTTAALTITFQDFKSSQLKLKNHINRRDAMIVEPVTWSDISGYEDLKQTIRESIEWPVKHAHLFSKYHIPAPSGLLLYGPPGCCKTMIAKAVATECGFNFFAVKGSELLSKYVGQSEKNVRNLFSRARVIAPSVIFFDEIESLVTTRQSSDVNSTNSILSTMLTEMDGMVALHGVFVLGATNMPHRVDKALLRPGRLNKSIYVPLPSSQTRRQILESHFKKMPVSIDVDVQTLVERTERYSGAEVVKLCRQAASECLLEDLSKEQVEMKHFVKVLTHLKPVATDEMLASYEDFRKSC